MLKHADRLPLLSAFTAGRHFGAAEAIAYDLGVSTAKTPDEAFEAFMAGDSSPTTDIEMIIQAVQEGRI